MYVDIDRHYFNDNSGADQYATINVDAGYQQLCGQDALDYVRYRHTDTDIVRAARQQDFLRQAKEQVGVGKLISNRRKLIEDLRQVHDLRHQLDAVGAAAAEAGRGLARSTRSRRSTSRARSARRT